MECEAKLTRFKWSRRVVHTGALPRRSTGKVQKFALRHEIA